MRRFLLAAAIFGAALFSRAQEASDYAADVLHDYVELQLEMIKITPGFTPPVASRALGFTGLGAYESVVHGRSDRGSLAGVLPQLNELPMPDNGILYHWPEVANQVMYELTANLYENAPSSLLTELDNLRSDYTLLHEAQTDAETISISIAYGLDLANALLVYADADGQFGCQYTNFPAEFEPPVGPGLWTPPPGQAALQPYWGDKRCFIVEFVSTDMLAPEPPEFSSEDGSVLYEEAMMVYNAVNNATEEEITIAEYWADGPGTVTPPGHSFSMLRQVLVLEDADLAFASEAYARMGFGVADAFVQCWKTKYEFNLERPITYIQSYIDPEWETIIGTPPFPEYTSGHSSQSGAFGAIMADLFGDEYTFTDTTHGELFGGPRTFTSFSQCAEETAVSRLYGGIHYPVGNVMGTMSGIMIGEMVGELFDQAVGVEQQAVAQNLNVYPNPSNGVIHIDDAINNDDRLLVYSTTGSLVQSLRAERRVDLANLPRGMYVVALADRAGSVNKTTRLAIH